MILNYIKLANLKNQFITYIFCNNYYITQLMRARHIRKIWDIIINNINYNIILY